MKERLASVPVIGWLLRVQERFTEVRGTALANGIALQTFLSIFPLVIVGVAVVGFLSVDDPDFAQTVIDNLELDADSAESFTEALETAQESRQAASVIGLAGLLFTGLNLVTAIQRSIDAAWQTHGKGVIEKLKALAWLGGASAIFVGSFGLSIALNVLPGFLAPLSLVAGFGVNVLLFLWTFTALGRVPVGWRARLPGALVCAFGFEVMKVVGSVYVPKLVADSSALYGSLGIVFAVLAWLAIFGRLLVYGSIVNVVQWEAAHGTVRVQITAPRIDGAIALETNRTGAVVDTLDG